MLKVTNWRKWQRAKGIAAAVLAFMSLWFIGGLEYRVGDEVPSDFWAAVCLGSALLIVVNIIRRDKEQGKPWF